jgi:hypothetical protein
MQRRAAARAKNMQQWRVLRMIRSNSLPAFSLSWDILTIDTPAEVELERCQHRVICFSGSTASLAGSESISTFDATRHSCCVASLVRRSSWSVYMLISHPSRPTANTITIHKQWKVLNDGMATPHLFPFLFVIFISPAPSAHALPFLGSFWWGGLLSNFGGLF